MKNFRKSFIFSICLLTSACNVNQTAEAGKAITSPMPTASMPSTPASTATTEKPHTQATLKLPDHFTAYASAPIGNRQICVAGSVTDEDGMNQKPMAYVADAVSKRVLWMGKLDLPADMYQSRATHCTLHGSALFVLLQSDTQSEQTLSQTLLRVVKIDAANGAVQLQRDMDVPMAYSAWVDEGSSHFQWAGDRLVITGNDKPDSDHDRQTTFTIRLNGDLQP